MSFPSCRFCKAPADHQSIKGKHVFGGSKDQHFYQCDQCQMIYLSPPMSEKNESKFYHQEFEKYNPNDLDRILITYGPNNDDVSKQVESVSKHACIFSEGCPIPEEAINQIFYN